MGVVRRHRTEVALVIALDLVLKALLLLFLLLVALDPAWGNLEKKAPLTRALVYPSAALLVPLLHQLRLVGRTGFPWLADVLATLIGFSDILGNRLDLFDRVLWFDDAMHVWNTALASGAVLLLTSDARAGLTALLERSVAVGMTLSLGWELWEYLSFVTEGREFSTAYRDTIGDLCLGWVGTVVAAVLVHLVQRRGAARGTPLPKDAGRPTSRSAGRAGTTEP